MKTKILFMSANPKDTEKKRFDEEFNSITQSLERAKFRDEFELKAKWAVSVSSFRRALLDEEPQIVHFSGHSSKENGIKLETTTGHSQFVAAEALGELFEIFSTHVDCVVLNACYSEEQVEAIIKHIQFVIGMREDLQEQSSIEFSRGFYDGIGAGKSIEDAFKLARSAIYMPGLEGKDIPIFERRAVKSRPTMAINKTKTELTSLDENINDPEAILDTLKAKKAELLEKRRKIDEYTLTHLELSPHQDIVAHLLKRKNSFAKKASDKLILDSSEEQRGQFARELLRIYDCLQNALFGNNLIALDQLDTLSLSFSRDRYVEALKQLKERLVKFKFPEASNDFLELCVEFAIDEIQ